MVSPELELEPISRSLRVKLSRAEFPGLIDVILTRQTDKSIVSMMSSIDGSSRPRKTLSVSAVLANTESLSNYEITLNLESGTQVIRLADLLVREIQGGFISRAVTGSIQEVNLWVRVDSRKDPTLFENLEFVHFRKRHAGEGTVLSKISHSLASGLLVVRLQAPSSAGPIHVVSVREDGEELVLVESDWPGVTGGREVNRGFALGAKFKRPSPWESFQQKLNGMSLRGLRASMQGRTAWIIGNGPSVSSSDLNRIAETGGVVFAFNRFHLSYPLHKLREDYLISTDLGMLRDFGDEILESSSGLKIFGGFPSRTRHLNGKFIGLPINPPPVCEFSLNPHTGISEGGSAPFLAMQIARYLGIRDVRLYGMDFDFGLEPTSTSSGQLLALNDGNHFISGYRSGTAWYPPNWWNIGRSFLATRLQYELDGLKITNVTRGGRLEIFERQSLEELV